MSQCPICLCEGGTSTTLCFERSHPSVCDECLAAYIESKIDGDFNGRCSTIFCPCLHETKAFKPIVDFRMWSTLSTIDELLLEKHKIHASTLLSFLCSGCHIMRTLSLVRATKQEREKAKERIASILVPEGKLEVFNVQLKFFENGVVTVEEFFVFTANTFELQSYSGTEDKIAWECFKSILLLIIDPERQCGLHLRYLRSRPRIWTPCCNKEHCFRCRTKEFHNGRSCADNTALLDSSIIECPSCRISLVKGDGCNTVTCVCGQLFSWAAEYDNTERSRRFLSDFPMETNSACVEVLCGDISGQELDAKAWRIRNKLDVDYRLMQWWKVKYTPCPSQVCAIFNQGSRTAISDGENEARILWELSHTSETEHCRMKNIIAKKSLFLTLYPRPEDRPAAAITLLQANFKYSNPLWDANTTKELMLSIELWKAENTELFEQEIEIKEAKLANQFLCLHGSSKPTRNQLLSGQIIAPLEWNRAISNNALHYSNEDLTVERIGGVSSYPAAFASLPAPYCKFTIVIDRCQRGPNWLTFGLAKRSMPTSSSDGVGRTRDTWGLCDDRSSAAGRCRVCSCGTELSTCRKFQCGDVLSALVDLIEVPCIIMYSIQCNNSLIIASYM